MLLAKVLNLYQSISIIPKIGAELEFYCIEDKISSIYALAQAMANISIKKEEGEDQFEALFTPTTQLIELVNKIHAFRQEATMLGGEFRTVPYPDRPPSALHFHINLLDKDHGYLFSRQGNEYNENLLYSLGGVCDLMSEIMFFALPQSEDYLRLQACPPLNVSWGANNRTVVLRLPENSLDNLRIEYRLIAPLTSLEPIIAVILIAIYHGLHNKLLPPPKVYGLAHKMPLPPLPLSLEAAINIFEQKGTLKKYIEDLEGLSSRDVSTPSDKFSSN